jgi:hypothetical protein
MTAEGCREWRERLGAYVLDQLSEDERAATSAHIQGCAACRAEAESLAPIAELLPKADPARLGTAPAPPTELAGRISTLIAREGGHSRKRRRRRITVALCGAAASATAAAVLLLVVLSPESSDPGGQRVVFTDLPPGVEIAATLEPRPVGTEIRMDVHGFPSGTLCKVFLRRADGKAMPAGSFRYRYGGGDEAVLTDALDISDARAIGVRVGDRTYLAPMRRGADPGADWNRTTT